MATNYSVNIEKSLSDINNGTSQVEIANRILAEKAKAAEANRKAFEEQVRKIEKEARAKSQPKTDGCERDCTCDADDEQFDKDMQTILQCFSEIGVKIKQAEEEAFAEERREMLQDVVIALSESTSALSQATLLLAQLADETLSEV